MTNTKERCAVCGWPSSDPMHQRESCRSNCTTESHRNLHDHAFVSPDPPADPVAETQPPDDGFGEEFRRWMDSDIFKSLDRDHAHMATWIEGRKSLFTTIDDLRSIIVAQADVISKQVEEQQVLAMKDALRIAEAERQRDKLTEALRKYGRHTYGCSANWCAACAHHVSDIRAEITGCKRHEPRECDCGFAALLAEEGK